MRIVPQQGDASEWISQIEPLVMGSLRLCKPEALVLVKIDGWFGSKWRRFSGKTLGAIGLWKDRLTIPSFVPNRVLSQRKYIAPTYEEVDEGHRLHVQIEGNLATLRFAKDVAPRTALVWYSGNSKNSGRGSLMVYLPLGDSYLTWYAGWSYGKPWRIVELQGITMGELSALISDPPASLAC